MLLRSQVKSLPCPRHMWVVSMCSQRRGSVSGRRGCQPFSWWMFTLQSCVTENQICFRNKCKCIILFFYVTGCNASCQVWCCPCSLQVQKWKICKCYWPSASPPDTGISPTQDRGQPLVTLRLMGTLGAGGGSGSAGTWTLPGLKKSMSWVRLTTNSWGLIPCWKGHPSTHMHIVLNAHCIKHNHNCLHWFSTVRLQYL